MTVGLALWPELLSAVEREQLDPGLPSELDRSPDVLVVGGGILGVATALACTRAQLGSVVLLERDQLGSGASGGAAGQLLPEAHVGVDPPFLVDLARRSLGAWRDFEVSLPGGVGLLDLDWLGLDGATPLFAAGLPSMAERLDADQVAKLVPGLAEPTSGVLVRHQARVNPLQAIAHIAAHLPSVATRVAVKGVVTRAGRVHSLNTSAGAFTPGTVVFATGIPPQLEGLDVRLPWHEVKGHMLVTEPHQPPLPGTVAPLATTIDDDRLMVGGTLDIGDQEHVLRPEIVRAMQAELRTAWPVAASARISHQWACFRPAHPDYRPVIDRLPGLTNVWLTSGHYRTGILMAPATANALAAWIRTGQRPAEVEGLAIDRFASA